MYLYSGMYKTPNETNPVANLGCSLLCSDATISDVAINCGEIFMLHPHHCGILT